jgi:lipopolysaccharide/colanic/teichoic acid biosynthesis glycosyltransferase
MAKRVFDWVMSSLGLLVLAPVLLLIALVVKLDSPGPVFFRQERVGRHGVPFHIHKFRTMRHAPVGQGLQITVGADARYVAVYPAELKAKVLSVRPGITDIASIEYRDESAVLARASDPEHAYIHEVLPHKLALAARYVDQASVWLDVRLIWRTLVAIVRR